MFNWVCTRCGHEVSPSKTECPFCAPTAPPAATSAAPPQYQPPQPVAPPPQPQQPQYAPPPQYWQQPQAPAPQQPPPPQYQQYAPPQQPNYAPPQAPPQYVQQQAPPQYWQQQPQQYPPPPSQQYEQPPYQQPPLYQPQPPQEAAPLPLAVQPPQYIQPVTHAVPEYRHPEPTPTPWPPQHAKTGKPAWLVATLTIVGVLVVLGAAWTLMSSHNSSSSKDGAAAAKQETSNPLQKDVEVVGIRIMSDKTKNGQIVKFLVVNHSAVELTDLAANVTLWASTSRSEEDAVGSFGLKAASIKSGEAVELSSPLKSEKGPADIPDWRNLSADIQITSPQ